MPVNDVDLMTAILYAEAANDPQGWLPKLNTYYQMRKGQESLPLVMQRVSSAYRKKSPQFQKALNKQLDNVIEKGAYRKIQDTITNFKPDPNWQYIHHENPDFYANDDVMIQKLTKLWGNDTDYANRKKIGREYYFPRRVK